MNRYEAIFGLGLATALVLDACGPKPTSAIEKPQSGDGGGQAGEVESIPNLISNIRAEKIDLSQPEMDAFNTKLQNPETQVVKYVAQGDGYIVTEIDPEVRRDAVCLEQERWGVEGSDAVDLCSTLIEGQELILTNNDRDELVALMPFTVASGIEGYAGLAQDGKTIVPILARGSDGEIYVYNQDTLQYHPLGGETQILDILDIDELFLKNGGGTVVDSRSRGVGHVTRLRFKNGIEVIQTPEGSFVSPQFIDLQTQIAASGETFTLLSDSTIEQMTSEGPKIVPGLSVDKNGVMTLSVGGEFVTLSPEEVSFTNELNVKGYKLDEATGEWEPAQETIDIGGNLSVILGEKVDGGTLIDSFVADPSLTPEQQAEKLEQTDYTEQLGFPAGSLEWMKTDEGDTALVRADDHNRIVGWWMRSRVNARTEMVWNAPELIDPETGESVFFNPGVARIWATQNGHTNEWDKMSVSMNTILNNQIKELTGERQARVYGDVSSIVSNDGSQTVFGLFATIPEFDTTEGNGIFFYEDGDENGVGNDQIKQMVVTGFEVVGPR